MNQKPIFDFSFPHEYEVDLAEELPGSGQNVIYHPGASTTGGKDGMLLRFMPLGAQEWLGCFAFGHSSYRFSGIFTTPNPHHACVISSGTAYWVNAKNQLDCSILKFAPVLDTRVLSEGKLLLMSDFVSIALVDVDGVVWRSPRLCGDELRISHIEDGIISGVGYDPVNMGRSDFSFDLNTRRVLKSGYPSKLGTL